MMSASPLVVWIALEILVLSVSTTKVLSWSTAPCVSNVNQECWSTTTMSSASLSGRQKRISSTSLFVAINKNIAGDTTSTAAAADSTRWVAGPDLATKPDYDSIHGPMGSLMDNIFLRVFRGKLSEHVGFDSNLSQV